MPLQYGAMSEACADGKHDEVKKMLADDEVNNADPNALAEMQAAAPGTGLGSSPLHHASCHGHLDIVKTLLKAKANPNSRNLTNRGTPLHRAARGGHHAICVLLLKAGAVKALTTSYGTTAIDMAREFEHYSVVELLAPK